MFATMLLVAKARTEKRDRETTPINMRVPDAILDRLERIGEPWGLTRSELIRQAIIEFVQRHEREAADQPPPQEELRSLRSMRGK